MDNAIMKLREDKGFQAIVDMYKSPNLLSIMGITKKEEYHTKLIAWLLDPKSDHGLSELPLRCLLEYCNNRMNCSIDLDSLDILNMEIVREWPVANEYVKRGIPDIVCKSESLIIVIENKIEAYETITNGEYQTDRYFNYFEKKYPDAEKLYIYLQPGYSANKPHNGNFHVMNYQDFYDYVISVCISYNNCPKKTEEILTEYAVAASSPRYNIFSIVKEQAAAVYDNNKEGFGRLRKIAENVENEKEVSIEEREFFFSNEEFLNLILSSTGQSELKTRQSKYGWDFINSSIEKGYITVADTEEDLQKSTLLTNKRGGASFVIQFLRVSDKVRIIGGYVLDDERTESNITDEVVNVLTDDYDELVFFRSIGLMSIHWTKKVERLC